MPKVKISDQEIFYAVRWNHVHDSTAPLVFIHGAGDSHLVWNGQLAAFSKQTRTLALDLPGHGRSTGAARTTILDYALAVREFLDGLEIERPVVVGISMGGAIAQMLALEYPERVSALGLVATGAKLRVAPQFLQGLQSDFETTARVLVENFYAPPPALPSPENRALIFGRGAGGEGLAVTEITALKETSFRQLLATGSAIAYADFAACDAFDVRERIAEIACHTLVVCGREDRMTPVKYSEFLAERIPRAQLAVIEGAGHMVMLEQPAAFDTALGEWLATKI